MATWTSPTRGRAATLVGALWLGLSSFGVGACAREEGLVEVYWQFQAGDLGAIYPQGSRSDSCEFISASGFRYDLQVQLTIAENSAACSTSAGYEGADCALVQEPIRFPCDRARGTAESVPISGATGTPGEEDPGYLMFVEAVINRTDSDPFVPNSSCILGPGPRTRRVLPGRITDLEVYQFVFLADDGSGDPIDTEACRPGAADGGTDTGTEMDSGTDTGTETGTDTGTETDTGTDTGTETGTDTGP